jgi:hypothetical protein
MSPRLALLSTERFADDLAVNDDDAQLSFAT